jgi:hypothetical protein
MSVERKLVGEANVLCKMRTNASRKTNAKICELNFVVDGRIEWTASVV